MTTQTVYSTAVTQWFIDAQNATTAGAAPVNLLGGTLKVGDGNGSVPTLSQILANNGVLHQVWAGAPNSIAADAANTGQMNVECLIPTVDGSGNEIGPFTVTEFAIYDSTGNLCIYGTTNLPKTTSAGGQLTTLQWFAPYIAAATNAVTIQPPAGSWPTLGQIQTALAGLLSAAAPLSLAKTLLSSGWTALSLTVAKATQPADASSASDAAAMGVGRPATNTEFGTCAPESGGFAWPWPTLQQVTGAVGNLEAQFTAAIAALNLPKNYSFDAASPPSAPISLDPRDTLTITFENVVTIPMHVAASQGVYSLKLAVSATNTSNSDWLLLPNDTLYANSFSAFTIEQTDIAVTSFATASSVPSYVDINSANNFAASQPICNLQYNDRPAFYFDTYGGPDGSDTLNGIGPLLQEMIVSTFTSGKMVKQSGGIYGGVSIGFSRWNDTTTPWTSLGTLYDMTATSMSGVLIIERLA